MSLYEMEQKLQETINNARYKPDTNCKECYGKGYIKIQQKPDSFLLWRKLGKKPCMCLYIAGQENRDLAQDIFNEIARKHRV